MPTRLFNPLERFARHRDGAVAVLFGLAIVPVAAMAGAAIDYSNFTADRAELQRAADAAAIATARSHRDGGASRPSADNLEALADKVVEANVPATGLEIVDVDHRLEGGVHVVEVDARRHGVFASLLGAGEQDLSVRADAVVDQVGSPAEIAIVMDVTNSMRFGNRWRDATSTIAATLERLKGTQGEFYVSLVPFSDRVNLSSVNNVTSWLTGTRPGPTWNGCVEPRSEEIGAFPHALDDDAPHGNSHRFLASIRQNLPARHVATGRAGMPACPSTPIALPTTDIAAIERALNTLSNTGTGRFDEGLAWGWRMLSPKWDKDWKLASYPAAYGEREKIVLFFTDGQSTAYEVEVTDGPEEAFANEDGIRAFGRNKATPVALAHMVDLCTRMKAAGVRIVMMQLEGNEHFTSYAQACASSPTDYFRIDGITDLETALAGVGLARAGGVRLVR